MKKKQATIKDIARQLGISPSTVSRALKDHPGISWETKTKVIQLAEQLNYEPNQIALSLKSKSTKTIGVIIPEIVHYFFSTVISGIEEVAYSKGYTVMFCQSGESYEREKLDTKALLSHRVDGILVSVSRETLNFEHFNEVKSRNIPLVFFDRAPEGFSAPCILINDFEAGKQATQHLIDQSCRRIAHLAGPPNLKISVGRLEGYISALQDNGHRVNPNYIIECYRGNRETGYTSMKKLLTLDEAPDGVFASNDITALGAMEAIKEAGLKIPDDIAVVGFSDWQICDLIEPRLSSVAQPGKEMGRQAAVTLINQLEGLLEFEASETTILPTKLIIRDSSKRLSAVKG